LNDVGQFRFELPQDSVEQSKVMHLEVDLMFADLSQHGGADRFGEQPDVDSTEFKCVSTAHLQVLGAQKGLHEFCPVAFDEYHFCLANIMLHSVLLDHRLRLQPWDRMVCSGIASGSHKRAADKGDGDSEDGARKQSWSKAPASSPRARTNGMAAAPTALSFSEFLFGTCHPTDAQEQLLQNAQKFYQAQLASLVASHTSLTQWLKDMCEHCLTPIQQQVLMGSTGLPELFVPTALEPSISGNSQIPSSTDPSSCAAQLGSKLESELGPEFSPRSVAARLAYDLDVVSCQVLETWHLGLAILVHAPREIALRLRESWERRIVRRWSTTMIKEDPRADVAVTEREDCCGSHSALSESLRKAANDADIEASKDLPFQDLSMVPPMALRPMIFEERYYGGGAIAACKSSAGSSSVRIRQAAPDAAQRPGSATPRSSRPTAAEAREMLRECDDCSSSIALRQYLSGDCIPSAPRPYRGVHLIVLVHGFQGNSFDMRLMRNNLALLFPDSIFLSSICNEDNTEGDITEMGIRLAQEVVNYICDWCPGSALARLSFVAHSLGGLIVRSALPLLHEYSSKMFTFMSFGTSHLGIVQDEISLFNTGFWMFKKWRKSTFLQQVSMTDHENPRETFLYKLSKAKGFEFFQNIVLASCYEDQYGPIQSARAEIRPEWAGKLEKQVYREMVESIWGPVHPDRVRRLDINFVIPEKNLDSFIGRAAHIQFLESQSMMRMLVHNYCSLFQ